MLAQFRMGSHRRDSALSAAPRLLFRSFAMRISYLFSGTCRTFKVQMTCFQTLARNAKTKRLVCIHLRNKSNGSLPHRAPHATYGAGKQISHAGPPRSYLPRRGARTEPRARPRSRTQPGNDPSPAGPLRNTGPLSFSSVCPQACLDSMNGVDEERLSTSDPQAVHPH
jgi:hypothetical protein